MKKIRVGIADLQIARAPAVLVSYGLGSCIGVALYDPYLKIGGLAHVMLPSVAPGNRGGDPLKFADTAVEAVVARMIGEGCARGALLAKMAGGADMFAGADPGPPSGAEARCDSRPRIGERNAQAVRAKLDEMGIPLVAEDVGGNHGRTVELVPATGDLVVRSVRKGCKIL